MPPRRSSAPASSSAKNGFPPEVSQSLSNVGRGNDAPSRVWSSCCIAPTLSPVTSTSSRPGSGKLRRSHGGTSPRTVTSAATGWSPRRVSANCSAAERRRVEPLEVVDGEADRPGRGEHPQRLEEGRADGALVDGGLRRAEEQGSLECALLDRRELRQDDAGHGTQEVGKPRVREPGLRLGRPRGQRPVAALGRRLEPGQPDRGLADPGVAPQHDGRRELRGIVEQPGDRPELLVPADRRTDRCGHVGVSCAAVAHEFKLPDLGEGLTEAEIARWLVAEGDTIAEDQPLVEVQTDKTTVEIPSPREGTVLKILVEEGEVAPVGAVLVVIGAEGEQLLRAVESQRVSEQSSEPLVSVVPSDPTAAVRATPAVRQLARSLGVELVGLQGSGPGGRIVEADVRAAAPEAEGRRVPVRGIRRAIVEQVTRAHREIPAVTFVEECDFTGLDVSRLIAHTIRAVASSVTRFPELNARLEGDEIVLLDRVDVGVAVQTDDGLVVPVVRGCADRALEDLDAELRRLADAARAGTLAVEELRDATITITSAGKLGGIFVTPLINHPDVAIVGLHRIGERPVVRDGAIVVRSVGNVSVTFDHRVVDGARAAAFCLDVIEQLQSGGAPAA